MRHLMICVPRCLSREAKAFSVSQGGVVLGTSSSDLVDARKKDASRGRTGAPNMPRPRATWRRAARAVNVSPPRLHRHRVGDHQHDTALRPSAPAASC